MWLRLLALILWIRRIRFQEVARETQTQNHEVYRLSCFFVFSFEDERVN